MPDVLKIIGLMSGTSLDGLDIAYVHLWKEGEQWRFNLNAKRSVSYTDSFRLKLKESINLSGMDLMRLDVEVGQKTAQWVKEFINDEQLEVDYIASHGHTIFHQVNKGFTTQIGNPHYIKSITGIPVIADFRYEDVVLGGQGAPLVPIGDQLLFSKYDYCLNLGGISNISFLKNGKRIAYDIGPANMLLNTIVSHINLAYDSEGQLARNGKVINTFLDELDKLDYYGIDIPKSLGFEWFETKVVPIVNTYILNHATEDLLATAVHHISGQIVGHIKRFSPNYSGQLMVSGGGALNSYLMEVLGSDLAPQVDLIIPDLDIVEYKEAIVFALMGAMRANNENNILCSVTGASRDSCGGVIYC